MAPCLIRIHIAIPQNQKRGRAVMIVSSIHATIYSRAYTCSSVAEHGSYQPSVVSSILTKCTVPFDGFSYASQCTGPLEGD